MPEDPPTVVKLPERNTAQAAGDHTHREMKAFIDNLGTLARLRRAAYLAYMTEGFTADQALQLCTK